jgi:hypothetical protein
VEVQGIDSLVGRWELSPQHQVSFDWGPFSDDLRQAPRILQDAVECTETVDGFAARLVMGLDVKGIWGPSRVPKVVVSLARDRSIDVCRDGIERKRNGDASCDHPIGRFQEVSWVGRFYATMSIN